MTKNTPLCIIDNCDKLKYKKQNGDYSSFCFRHRLHYLNSVYLE